MTKSNLEQFQEAARDAIDLAFWSWNENGKDEKDAIDMAVSLVTDAATSLVEAVIGEDEPVGRSTDYEAGDPAEERNELRASQRAKLKEQTQ